MFGRSIRDRSKTFENVFGRSIRLDLLLSGGPSGSNFFVNGAVAVVVAVVAVVVAVAHQGPQKVKNKNSWDGLPYTQKA